MQVLFEVHRQKLRVTWQVSGGKTSALDPGLDGSRRHAEYIGDVFNSEFTFHGEAHICKDSFK